MAVIASIMKREMVTARPDKSVAEVAAHMKDNGVGAVLVLDDGALVGLFSERDLLVRVVVAGLDPQATKVIDVATAAPTAVEVDTPVKDCARIFREGGFRHLPVLENGKPAGILSSRDFTDYVVNGLERFIDQRKYEDQLADGADPYDHIGGGWGS